MWLSGLARLCEISHERDEISLSRMKIFQCKHSQDGWLGSQDERYF